MSRDGNIYIAGRIDDAFSCSKMDVLAWQQLNWADAAPWNVFLERRLRDIMVCFCNFDRSIMLFDHCVANFFTELHFFLRINTLLEEYVLGNQ